MVARVGFRTLVGTVTNRLIGYASLVSRTEGAIGHGFREVS